MEDRAAFHRVAWQLLTAMWDTTEELSISLTLCTKHLEMCIKGKQRKKSRDSKGHCHDVVFSTIFSLDLLLLDIQYLYFFCVVMVIKTYELVG